MRRAADGIDLVAWRVTSGQRVAPRRSSTVLLWIRQTPVMPHNLLLTGPPGCGKTTAVRRVIDALGSRKLSGFYTEEIRLSNQRVGFRAIGLNGSSAVLAHVDFRSTHRVGRYGVDVDAFEAVVRSELDPPSEATEFIVIDEIGKMECLSRVFVDIVSQLLDCRVPVLATVAAKAGGFIAEVKARDDVEITTLSPRNPDAAPQLILQRLLTGFTCGPKR